MLLPTQKGFRLTPRSIEYARECINFATKMFWRQKIFSARPLWTMKCVIESDARREPQLCEGYVQTNVMHSLISQLEYRYHFQVLEQANVLFWFSLGMTVIGLLLIIYIVIWGGCSSHYQVLLNVFPGAMIELLAGLIFRQASEAQRRATIFLDKLRADRRYKDIVDLVESVDDRGMQDNIRACLVLQIIDQRSEHL